MDRLRLGIGQVRQRGWTFDDKGGSFTVFSKHAERIELAVLHPTEAKEEARISLERNGDEHSVVLSGARPGLRYGLRAHGVYDVSQGHRFDGSKFLIDPYAFGLQGEASYDGPILSSDRIGGASTFGRDSFGSTPISIARDRRESSLAPPPMTRRPGVPWEQTVLYECSVETLTKRHPHVTRAEQGKFLGLASDPMLEHFRAMGITTVELLPVMASLTEPAIALRGRRNLWGYNTLGYFVPDARFVVDPSRGAGEFVEMVNRLHDAGFEVVLDMVLNHTAEGDNTGPILCWKGLDNAFYYRLGQDRSTYVNWSGCGNTLHSGREEVVAFMVDVLRFWASLGVDGFRLDLGAALGRGPFDGVPASFDEGDRTFRREHPLWIAIENDAALAPLKWIAEPWDVSGEPTAYGQFPPQFLEWNGSFRDDVRAFWNGHARRLGPLGYRLSGSSDLFANKGKGVLASIQYVTAHDGFTLRDLVSYGVKHNEANGEENRDGAPFEHAKNHGVEGETQDEVIVARRKRQMRNLLATLLLSPGVPMLSSGDENGMTRHGNNNGYLADLCSEVPWEANSYEMVDWIAKLVAYRRDRLPTPSTFFTSEELLWRRFDGGPMTERDWTEERPPQLLVWRNDCDVLYAINSEEAIAHLKLPPGTWRIDLDSSVEIPRNLGAKIVDEMNVPAVSFLCLSRQRDP